MNGSDPTTVFITGASSGIGLATVERLDARGYRIYAGVRRDDDAERLAQRGSAGLIPVCLDLTNPASIERALTRIEEDLGGKGLDAVVNNAGTTAVAPLEFTPLETVRHQFDINIIGHLAVLQAALRLLRCGGSGRIINIGSVSGRVSTPFTGAYNASKAALRSLGDALRVELAPWNISVSLIEPGTVLTPMWTRSLADVQEMRRTMPPEAERLYGPVFSTLRSFIEKIQRGGQGLSSEEVAKVIERVIQARRPRAHYIIGSDARLRLILGRMPTRMRDWVLSRLILPPYPSSEER